MKKKINWQQLFSRYVLALLVIAVIYLIFEIIAAPVEIDPSNIETAYERVKSDYVLMLVQCLLGIVAMFIPSMAKHKLNLEIPSGMLFLYTIFLYCAIYLGEVRSFYYSVPHWDTILHTFSGGMLGALGFSFVTLLNETEKIPMNLSPVFVAIFAFCFALTLGVFWEIYEFTFDGILGLNMQKFALENGTQFMGRAALTDTMKDLIVDALGAFVVCFIGFISLKYKKGWVEKLMLKVDKNNKTIK